MLQKSLLHLAKKKTFQFLKELLLEGEDKLQLIYTVDYKTISELGQRDLQAKGKSASKYISRLMALHRKRMISVSLRAVSRSLGRGLEQQDDRKLAHAPKRKVR